MQGIFDASEYGAPEDPAEDCTPAIQRAADDLRAYGGGTLVLPDRTCGWRICSPLVLATLQHVEIVGPHQPIVVDSKIWPAVQLVNCDDVRLSNLDLACNQVPPALPHEGDPDFSALLSVERCGDVEIDRLTARNCVQAIVCGTPAQPNGARRLVVRDAALNYRDAGVKVWGCAYLEVDGGHWQDTSAAGTAVWIGGKLYADSTDGIDVRRIFVEHTGTGVRLAPETHTVANVRISDCRFDRVGVVGVWVSPGIEAMVHILDVTSSRLNCLDGAYPILLEGAGEIAEVHVAECVQISGGREPPVVLAGPRITDVEYHGEQLA